MTETINFEHSLNNLLACLDKKDWATPLKELEQKFRQIPDHEGGFRIDLINMLHQLCSAMTTDTETPLELLAAIRLSTFDCWTYRFFRDDAHGRHYLDPLTTTKTEFSGDVVIGQSSEPYPATDIIKRWAREHLQ
jgi:hypothetical protein